MREREREREREPERERERRRVHLNTHVIPVGTILDNGGSRASPSKPL